MARGFRGVKDDLSEIGRHLLDIACFLAPLISTAAAYTDSPPSSPHSPPPPPPTPRVIAGALRDLADIGGSFRSGLSRLSTAVKNPGNRERACADGSSFSRAAGVTEEVLDFVRDLIKCPESWIEFPVPVDNNFDISHHQREHIVTVERMAPSLAALRVSLCPNYMSEESFWKIYFALLHPRLNKHESELLSTQQIVEEMRINLKKMQNRVRTESPNPAAESLVTPAAESFPSVAMRDKATDVQEEDLRITEATSTQYIDCWFDTPAAIIPREVDASSETRRQSSSRGEDYYSEADDDVNITLLKRYTSSSSGSVGAAGEVFSSSNEQLQFRKKPDKELTDEEPGDWQAVEDSDYEIVEKS